VFFSQKLTEACQKIETFEHTDVQIKQTNDQHSGAFRGRVMVRPPFGLTVNFWDNFCAVFVSFVSRPNGKIHVPRLLATVFSAC